MRATSWDVSLFHTRSPSEGANKSAHLAVSLEPYPPVNMALCTSNCFRSELPSSQLRCEYERFRHTGWSTKESWDVSGVYLFVYLSTVKPAVAVTCIKCDPPLSGHFRVPPNDFECKCTSIKRVPVQRGQRSAKFAPKRWNCIRNGHFPWFSVTVWLNFIDKLFCTGQMLGAIKLPSSGVS